MRESILDPSIGTLVLQHAEWGIDEKGDTFSSTTNLKSHTCTDEELGLKDNNDESRFMPIHQTSIGYVKLYKKKFVCLEPADLELYGNFNSANAKRI